MGILDRFQQKQFNAVEQQLKRLGEKCRSFDLRVVDNEGKESFVSIKIDGEKFERTRFDVANEDAVRYAFLFITALTLKGGAK